VELHNRGNPNKLCPRSQKSRKPQNLRRYGGPARLSVCTPGRHTQAQSDQCRWTKHSPKTICTAWGFLAKWSSLGAKRCQNPIPNVFPPPVDRNMRRRRAMPHCIQRRRTYAEKNAQGTNDATLISTVLKALEKWKRCLRNNHHLKKKQTFRPVSPASTVRYLRKMVAHGDL